MQEDDNRVELRRNKKRPELSAKDSKREKNAKFAVKRPVVDRT